MIRYDEDGPYFPAVIMDSKTLKVVGTGLTRQDCQQGLDDLAANGVVFAWEVADACSVIGCPEAALCLTSTDGSPLVPMCFDHALA